MTSASSFHRFRAGLALTIADVSVIHCSNQESHSVTRLSHSLSAQTGGALLVDGEGARLESDLLIETRRRQLGHYVQVITDRAATRDSARSQGLVVNSESAFSGNLGDKFTEAATPVVSWDATGRCIEIIL